MKKNCLLHYWLNVLHYREVLHYWLILLHYREVLHYCYIKLILAKSNNFKKKQLLFITLLGNFITLSGSITSLVDCITLSRNITLSEVLNIIGAKYYN